MQLTTILASLATVSGLAAAQSSSWSAWTGAPTTTVTLTLYHANQTVTKTSYSATGTGTAILTGSSVKASATSTAAIATFSAGSAVVQEVNVAIAAVAGMGAVAYGML